MNLGQLSAAAEAFKREAEAIFGFSETSVHRTAELSESYAAIDTLTANQADMLRQALRCVEVGVYRAAHVLGWACLADFLQQMAERNGFAALNAKYPDWHIRNLDDLRDRIGEFNLIEGMFHSGMITKTEKKALQALLNKRNECAHPTDYFPDLNQSIGFIAECINRLKSLSQKYI